VLAHAGGAPETLSVVFLFSGLWAAWAGWSRLKGRGFPRMPKAGAWGLIAAAVVLVLCAGFVPPAIYGPNLIVKATNSLAPGPRPASTATIGIVKPTADQAVSGDELEVVMTLNGGTIIQTSTTNLQPDTGHIHLSIDGTLVSMTYGLVQLVPIQSLAPGKHVLEAEFVAADHGPFDPRVTSSVEFVKGSG
jgi:hypothetical protein